MLVRALILFNIILHFYNLMSIIHTTEPITPMAILATRNPVGLSINDKDLHTPTNSAYHVGVVLYYSKWNKAQLWDTLV